MGDITAEEAMELTLQEMGDRDDIGFGEPLVTERGAIVSITGDDALVGPYDGVILMFSSTLDGGGLLVELRLTFDADAFVKR